MEKTGQNGSWSRRSFLRRTAAGGLGLSVAGAGLARAEKDAARGAVSFESKPLETVRVGFVGVGLQGSSHIQNLLQIEGVEIRAVCDTVEWKVARIQDWVTAERRPRPEAYTRGETDFERLCQRDDLDLVITATPWRWHVPVCLSAMRAGKHAATEVPAAVTLEECFELVETSEHTGRHCVMLENCCYSERALLTLNLVRKGLLGEIIHGTAGYLHDLREVKFNGKDEAVWRTAQSVRRNGDLYPTHGLGPVAEAMDINRGDRFDYLVSMSTVSRGLSLYAARRLGPDDPAAKQRYALGDVVTSLIHTANGRTITLVHDTSSPRPYSRIERVQGTKGIIEGYPDRVHIEGRSPEHEWEPFDRTLEEHGHPLWEKVGKHVSWAGHGGMDYLEDYRLIDALRKGRYPDMDVYDAAAWSAVSALSERSIAERSQPVDFPDFTSGRFESNPRIFVTDL
jgi:predicted dehydrogenase